MPSALKRATHDITAYFEKSQNRVYTSQDLRTIFSQERYRWDLPSSTTPKKFVEFLLQNTLLRTVSLTSETYGSIERFEWGKASPHLLALSIKKGSYLSHATAVFLHALTDQIPKTIYVNHEQTIKPKPSGALSQESLDRAFAHPQRRSNYKLKHDSWQIVLLSGKNTGRLGVIDLPSPQNEPLQVTSLERTLIDIVVRPDYSGGIYQILQAYKSAKDKMSVNVLLAHLKKLDYMYPFHQAIGFYMQKAGYETDRLERLKALPIKFDFYLAHDIGEKAYDPSWRLFFPKGLQ
ncbi:MAG: hypothetical protein WB680_22620 [Candidatus Acidiferrales bacterium]